MHPFSLRHFTALALSVCTLGACTTPRQHTQLPEDILLARHAVFAYDAARAAGQPGCNRLSPQLMMKTDYNEPYFMAGVVPPAANRAADAFVTLGHCITRAPKEFPAPTVGGNVVFMTFNPDPDGGRLILHYEGVTSAATDFWLAADTAARLNPNNPWQTAFVCTLPRTLQSDGDTPILVLDYENPVCQRTPSSLRPAAIQPSSEPSIDGLRPRFQ